MTVRTHELPNVVWHPTRNFGDRHGYAVARVVLHTWGVRFVNELEEHRSYDGVVNYFTDPASQVSAHFVYPGSASPNEITQMVRYVDYAWTEAAYNPSSVEIECADAIWQGHDPDGFEQLAHIVGYLLHHFRLPCLWSHERGFCRHADLGYAGGGHLSCPTTNIDEWRRFAGRVEANYNAGGYRAWWGH